ncbi:nucleotidyltransferase family protein [Amylibacter sp.]|nr:nucleotidyltransferase family protein [Amylibacter sp.]
MQKDHLIQWRSALVPADATLQQVIRNLDDSSLQISLVTSPDEVLVGTVTDGDIRRGLLRGLDMNSPIDSIIHRDAMVASPQISRDLVIDLMRANGVSALPILNESRQVVGLHLLNELLVPEKRPNPMVIMAGGRGTRLMPHTENCPKPMLPLGDKPMLEHIIERAKAQGFKHFLLSIYYLGHMIEDYFGDGSQWQVQIEYLREDTPLGTAGAIGLMVDRPKIPFLVTNGDVITDIDYGELLGFHVRQGATATMAVRAHEWQHPFGVVQTDGIDILGFEEKPISRSYINAGVYALDPDALDLLYDYNHCDMPTLFERIKNNRGRTVAYPMHEPWLDVGRPDDLIEAHKEASRKLP